MQGPIAGIKVLDLGAFGVGPMAASFLGSMGAEAIRIEPPLGDGLMYVGTLIGGMGSGYISSHFNKKNIVLDLKSKKGKEIAFKLVKWADVVIENRRLGALERLGLGYEAVSKINPHIIYISSTAYGHKGPWARHAAADPYVQAASGFASINGKEGGEPELLRYPVLVDINATQVILEAVLLGLLARQTTGQGQKIETSHIEAAIALQTSRIAEFLATGVNPKRMGSGSSVIVPSQSFLAADSKYINISVPRDEYWPKLCKALELDELQNDPRFETNAQRVKHRAELIPLLEKKIRDKPSWWWVIHLERCDVPSGFIYTYEDVVHDACVLENKMIVDLPTPWGVMKFSDLPLRFSQTPAQPMRPPVLPDQDHDEILKLLDEGEPFWNLESENSAKGRPSATPLEGLKVIDLTEEVSGAFCSMQLGDVGADVIKVEGLLGDCSRSLGPSINGESARFMALNRNKKSVVVNINTKEGREIVYQLAKDADVFLESFHPSLVDELALGYEDIRRINPNIIYASISPFGENGSYRDKPASELEIQGMAGLMQFLGEPGEGPVRLGADVAAVGAGMWAFIGVLAALYYRRKTGYGQKVEASMLGSMIAAAGTWLGARSNPDEYAGYHLTGPYDHAETGYKTKDVPIIFGLITRTLQEGRQSWKELCRRLGLEGLLSDPWFREYGPRTLGIGRDAQELKQFYESATQNKSSMELINLIDEVGGMGAAFNNYELLFGERLHPQVASTEMIQEITHFTAGKVRMTGFPWKLQKTPAGINRPPPTLGQHTRELLTNLGYDEGAIARLEREQVVVCADSLGAAEKRGE